MKLPENFLKYCSPKHDFTNEKSEMHKIDDIINVLKMDLNLGFVLVWCVNFKISSSDPKI